LCFGGVFVLGPREVTEALWNACCAAAVATGLTGAGHRSDRCGTGSKPSKFLLCVLVCFGSEGCLLVSRSSSTSVAAWAWPSWVVSWSRVLEVVFVLLESPSPSRRIFIGSHSPPSGSLYRSFKWYQSRLRVLIDSNQYKIQGWHTRNGDRVLHTSMARTTRCGVSKWLRSSGKGQILWDVTVDTGYVQPMNFLAPGSRDKFDANNKAVDYLFRALCQPEFDRVHTEHLACRIWSVLKEAHVGNAQVQARMYATYRREYENFTHLPSESIDALFQRFTVVVNNKRANGRAPVR
jgi:hypothetical protein